MIHVHVCLSMKILSQFQKKNSSVCFPFSHTTLKTPRRLVFEDFICCFHPFQYSENISIACRKSLACFGHRTVSSACQRRTILTREYDIIF